MKSGKKVLIIIGLIFVISMTLVAIIIAKVPQITGEINLEVEESLIVLNNSNCYIDYINDSLKDWERLDIYNGYFERRRGQYGANTFRLLLDSKFLGEYFTNDFEESIIIEFGYVVTNNWYKENVDLLIIIDDITDSSCKIKLIQTITGHEESIVQDEFEIRFSEQENNNKEIRIYSNYI